ncbi:MAG: bifunctional chorismate mutase/prephenate dehydratase [Clostridia bacterium]|nr:bifunctional chorismate mutase/prephenate dehydratase [Clostridia bacterium]
MKDLGTIRKEISEIDAEMAKLFERRMNACRDVAEYKREHALPILDAAREAEILAKGADRIEEPSLREYYAQFMKDVMKNSRAYQTRLLEGMKVVYSGVEGAFGHIAAKKAFPQAQIEACADFGAAYRGVEEGLYDCAVLPIENSYAGDVGDVMDLMFSGSLYVNQVVEIDVNHNLLAKPGVSLDKIRRVVSHPQALEQCAEFIRANGWETLSYSNTAMAAKYVAEQDDETVAAIASTETAEVFGLEVLSRNVHSARNNTTRFVVLSRAQSLPAPTDRTGREHFMLMFTTKNEAGALVQPLNILGAHNFNMRNLRSRPMKELIWNYYFFVEAEGNISTQSGQDMLHELSAVCAQIKLVGTYR